MIYLLQILALGGKNQELVIYFLGLYMLLSWTNGCLPQCTQQPYKCAYITYYSQDKYI